MRIEMRNLLLTSRFIRTALFGAATMLSVAACGDEPCWNPVAYAKGECLFLPPALTGYEGVTEEDVAVEVSLATETALEEEWTFDIVENGANGTATITGTTLSYVPARDFFGTDEVKVRAKNENGVSPNATVTIEVTPVPDAPTASDDTAEGDEDNAIAIIPLDNDSDADGDTLSVTAVETPAHGTVVIESDGTLTYTPDADYNGTDEFGYTIADPSGLEATARITVTVHPVNDAPRMSGGDTTTAEETPVDIGAFLAAVDPEGDAITWSIDQAPAHGTLVGTLPDVDYVPATDYNGGDTVVVRAEDGAGAFSTATVTITITGVNDAPVAVDDSLTVNEDTPGNVVAAANDTDVDGDSLTVSSVGSPTNGSAVLEANGSITYTPDADYNGSDSFTYTVSDGNGGTDTGTVNVTINAVNDAPRFTAADSLPAPSTNEDTALGLQSWVTAIDVEGDTITYSVDQAPASGTLTGTWPNVTYTPDADFNGSDTFIARAVDQHGAPATKSFTILVTAVNDNPVAVDDSLTIDEDQSGNLNPAGNDTDVDGDSLTVTSVSTPSKGTAVLEADGSVTYTPDADVNGSDSFTYTVSDGNGGSDTGTVNITINPVNDTPVLYPPVVTTSEDTPFAMGSALATFAHDADGDTLIWVKGSDPAHGIVTGTGPDWTYTPSADFHGTDTFNIRVEDPSGATSSYRSVEIQVTSVNDTPVAYPQTVTVDEDTPVGITLGGSDADGDLLTYEIGTGPATGTLTGTGNSRTYTPDENVDTDDSFTYRVVDPSGAFSDWETITIDVTPINDLPYARTATYSVGHGKSVAITLEAVDPDSVSLTYNIATPAHGALTGTAPNLTYTADSGYVGMEVLSFTASDAEGPGPAGAIHIDVTNEAPTVQNHAFAAVGNTRLKVAPSAPVDADWQVEATGSLLDGASDSDGGPVALSVATGTFTTTGGGSVTIAADGSFTYDPPVGERTSDTFTYTVGDGADTSTGTVTINMSGLVWYVDPTGAGNKGTSTEPFASISSLEGWSPTADGDVVYLAPTGTHTGSANFGSYTKKNMRILGGTVSLEVGGHVLAAAGATRTVIDGLGAAYIIKPGDDFEVRGLELTNAQNAIAAEFRSGLIVLSDLKITNTSKDGIYILNHYGELIVENSDLQGGSSSYAPLYIAQPTSGSATIENNVFNNPAASYGLSVGNAYDNGFSVTVTENTFHPVNGNPVMIGLSQVDGAEVVFMNNQVSNTSSGAILNVQLGGGTALIQGNTLTDSGNSYWGGMMFNLGSKGPIDLQVHNNTISGLSSTTSSGIYVSPWDSIVTGNFTGNTLTSSGATQAFDISNLGTTTASWRLKGNSVAGFQSAFEFYSQDLAGGCYDMGGSGGDMNTFTGITTPAVIERRAGSQLSFVQADLATLSAENDSIPIHVWLGPVREEPTWGVGSCPM